jgi:hypothetical protein
LCLKPESALLTLAAKGITTIGIFNIDISLSYNRNANSISWKLSKPVLKIGFKPNFQHFNRCMNTVWKTTSTHYECGVGNAWCCLGGAGIWEGGANRTKRNGNRDGLASSVAFRSTVCPFLNTVNVILSPGDFC